jgi:hypothetical protein
VVLPFLSKARVSGSAPGTYAIGIFYSGDGCPAPVTLRSFAVE